MRTRSKYNSSRKKSSGKGNMPHISQSVNPIVCGASQTSAQTPITTSGSRPPQSNETNSKTDNRTIPINVAKNLITRHIEQMVVNTLQPSADFPTISEYFGPPSRNMNGNFIPENPSYNIPPRTHDTDTKTYLQISPPKTPIRSYSAQTPSRNWNPIPPAPGGRGCRRPGRGTGSYDGNPLVTRGVEAQWHAAGRLDVLNAWAFRKRWKTNVLKRIMDYNIRFTILSQ